MPKLYVANVKQQIEQFTYWVPEAPRYFTQEIPIGSQVLVAGKELSQVAIDGILRQHRQYGLVSASDALSGRVPFYGVCYQVDRPVRLDHLLALANRLSGILVERGKKLREEAAIATDDYTQNLFREQGINGRLETLEMSVEEVSRDQRDDSPEVSEGVRVLRRGPPPGDTPTRARRGGRRAAA